MTAWRWLAQSVVLAGHEEQLAEHGGRRGVRDMDLLRAALARPQHKAAYETVDAAALAAAYAFGISRNHPFVDGNKRAALVIAEAFLLDNGFELTAGDADVVAKMLALASGGLGEDALAVWMRDNIVPLEQEPLSLP